jgi:ABC-type uncharacterized transport system substrate-binding protein
VRRRAFLHLISRAVVLLPLAASAQQPDLPVIGYLSPTPPEGDAANRAAFSRGLGEAGFIEGRNVKIEYRWARGEYDRLPKLAADLVARNVNIIASGPLNSTLAAKAATSTIPIVCAVGVDPVEFGLVPSYSHPGGNLTGVAVVLGALWPKRLQLLHELVPSAKVIAVLINPHNRNADANTRQLRPLASTLGLRLIVLPAVTERDIDAAFARTAEEGRDGMLVGDDPYFEGLGSRLTQLAAQYRVPTIYFDSRFVAPGGLISYGGILAMYRIAGRYTGRILKGEKPGDLPIDRPTKFELVVNLKTAKQLGLTVPPELLARADEVIE